jgi:leucyl/phenylalanyl-tRNA---protein transferase
MPSEPPATAWVLTPAAAAPGEDLIGVGADLGPGTVLAAYRSGMFPMPLGRPVGRRVQLGWWSPDPRAVLPLDGLRVSHSLRRACRRAQVRVDTAFDEVVTACADPRRRGGWITREIRTAYGRLHRLGWAHSVEVWRADRLVGGLYGVAIGGLFAGESMFHRETDASKVALVGLVERLSVDGGDGRVLDVQWLTPHLASLGSVEVTREEYLRRLQVALELPLPEAFGPGPRP